ncbi:MAG: hypothetical protein HY275_03360 [Gemmatimonadetes bacterium]|nr:hypothetical protein [Gemmatimonadota bacterium]
MLRSLRILWLLTVVAACRDGGSSGPTDPNNPYGLTTTGPGLLTVTPLDTTQIIYTSPLGYLAPPGHVLPTDHVYLSFVDPFGNSVTTPDCSRRPVRAAGAGVVTFTLVTDIHGDTKVDVQMTKTFHYYYDHVLLKPGITVGARVAAGDTIGTTTGYCPSMDLGVVDYDVTNPGMASVPFYPVSSLHAVSPYKYFTPALAAFLRARSRVLEGVPVDPDGRIDWTVAGHLVGDWFHPSLPRDGSVVGGPTGWPKSLSFAYDWQSQAPRISIGGTIAPSGVLATSAGDPDFATVTPASGLVAFHGSPKLGLIGASWVLARMTDATHLTVEVFPDGPAAPTAFTGAAQVYVR